MAEFERICKEWKRMHETVPDCSDCPLSLINNETAKPCYEFVRDSPVTAEGIIMKWAEDHPVMTNHRKFEEVFGMNLFKLLPDATWGDIVKWLHEEYKGEKNG